MSTTAAIAEHVHNLKNYMGELLGPKPVVEIVITHYANDQINFQFEGMGQPTDPVHIYKLLAIVAKEVEKQFEKQLEPIKEAPSE